MRVYGYHSRKGKVLLEAGKDYKVIGRQILVEQKVSNRYLNIDIEEEEPLQVVGNWIETDNIFQTKPPEEINIIPAETICIIKENFDKILEYAKYFCGDRCSCFSPDVEACKSCELGKVLIDMEAREDND